MKTFVLDASVGAKWFLPESSELLTREAEDILNAYLKQQISLLVPDLFWPELANVLRKSVLRKRITEDHADKSLAKARDLHLPVLPSVNLVEQALMLALAFGRSVYDSLYIAAAMSAGVQLLTADERFVNATGTRLPVRWLGALPSIL